MTAINFNNLGYKALGFGKVTFMGANGGCMMVDADGTRHSYTGQASSWSNGASFNGYTTDGSFIDYGCNVYYGQSSNAWAKLPNGTVINYSQQGAANDYIFPTSITDVQGNYINITYRNGQGPNIETVTDTMGRVLQFQYDSLGRLISITAPKMGGGTRALVKLHYQQRTLNYSFTGVTPVVRNNSPYLLDAIYYPASGTGYWFGDADSYSSYGMIAKIVEQRGMSWSASSEEQGTVTPGQMTKQAVYSYPLNPTSGLNNAPTYGQLSETWAEMDVAAAVTTYEVSNNTSPRTVTITQPDGSKSKQYSYNAIGQWNDGLIYQEETYDASNNLIGRSNVTWAPGEYSSARPARTDVQDERGQTTFTEFDYTGGRFNQVTRSCDYGYDGIQLRCTNTEYENSPNYIGQVASGYYSGRHILNLVKATEVQAPNGMRMSRTEYEYDNASLAGIPAEIVQHKDEYDPYTTTTRWVRGACIQTGNFQAVSDNSEKGEPDSLMSDPCIEWEYYEVPAFDSATNYRGNVTKITSYANAQNLIQAINDAKRYDIAGNMVTSSTEGGTQTSFNYTIDTQYAYPTSQTRGSSDQNSPHRITINTSFDFNTGLITSTMDANGRNTVTQYNPETLRATAAHLPTGAYTSYVYDDSAMSVTEQTHQAGGSLATKSIKYLNGLGKIRREEAYAPNNQWDAVETKYDQLGREWKQTKPYRNGIEAPQWVENLYDAMGRVIKVIETDGSQSQAFYNETSRPVSASNLAGQTVRSVDMWGRERWIRKDELGRLAEVVEPNPSGNGSVFAAGSLVTNYKYDVQNRLIETEQGNQRRYFAYDSLGRLSRQKLAEQTATLNNDGVYVGAGSAGSQWSDAFWYDNRSNLSQRTDARGVKTYYSYQINGVDDPLNRLQSVVYDLAGPRDSNLMVHGAWNVEYQYETNGDKTRIKRVTAQGISTEDYIYDTEGRVSDYTSTLTSRPSHPMTTSYIYDTLNRVTDVRYPAQYGLPGNPRKVVHHDYGIANRLTLLKYDNQTQASELAYNAASQTTSLKIGAGTNQLTEEYSFDPQTGLLTNQKVKRANGERLLDLSYEYRRKINGNYVAGRTGHLTEIVNNLDRNKDRQYEYDALGRLTKAVGGINQTWTQTYSYDRYGNRTNVNAYGVESLRAEEGQAGIETKQPNSKEQNSIKAKPTAMVSPPTAVQLVKNVNSFVKVGRGSRGASSDSLNSTGEFINIDHERSGSQKTTKSEVKEERAIEEKTGSSDDRTESQSATKTAIEMSESAATSATSALLLPPPSRPGFDFDGDNKADVSTWNRTNGTWTIRRSQSGQTTATTLGGSGNQIAPGDYDGDGKTDEAVWNPSTGVWTIKQSSTGNTITQQWGASGDAIVPADYDGDGKTDVAVWRPSTGVYYIIRSSNGSWYYVQFGGNQWGDIPTLGDFDGDNKADIAVWRPSNGVWYVLQSSNGQVIYPQFGANGDVPVPADYDADNKTDLAVWRPSTGYWYVYKSSNGQVLQAQLGSESARDVLVPADYDNDQQADMAVWTPSSGTWTIRQSTTGTNATQQLGASGQLAVPSAYVRRSSAPKSPNTEIQRDGHAALSYDTATNRITTTNPNGQFEYDSAGNQIRALSQDGQSWLRYEYDAANRLVYVKNDSGTILQNFTYGATNARLIARNGAAGDMTFYASAGGNMLAEYTEYTSQPNNPFWTKSHVFMGGRLLLTATPSGQGGESYEYHHPDKLGTRLVSNLTTGGYYEQVTLPFGTALNSESTGATNQRFTSYDRSLVTGLDYAVNRTYDSQQGRFTQVDPIGMKASSLENPQTLNLYSYCGNDPVNHTDPDGLFFGKLFKWIGKFLNSVGKILSAIGNAVAKILNNRWVRIGIFIAGFIIPGLQAVSAALASVITKAISIYNYIADIASLLQISGQLLTGQWKDLALTFGFAFVSAIVSPLVNGVVGGLQNAVFGGGVGAFTAALKTGWQRFKHNVFERGLKALLPGLDIFAGPDVPSDEDTLAGSYEDVEGYDAPDNLYKRHDRDLLIAKEAYKGGLLTRREYLDQRIRIHSELVSGLTRVAPRLRLTDIAFAGRPSVGSVYKVIALTYFSGSIVYRKLGR